MSIPRMCRAAADCMHPTAAVRPHCTPLRMNAVRHQVMAAAQLQAKQLLRKTVKQALRQIDDAERQRQSALQLASTCWTLYSCTLHMQRTMPGIKAHLLIAGGAICSSVLASAALQEDSTFGCYVHAERLLEVDTTAVLDALLARGADTVVNCGDAHSHH